jgi:hypothetical protein
MSQDAKALALMIASICWSMSRRCQPPARCSLAQNERAAWMVERPDPLLSRRSAAR